MVSIVVIASRLLLSCIIELLEYFSQVMIIPLRSAKEMRQVDTVNLIVTY